jgi:hypothetical protein
MMQTIQTCQLYNAHLDGHSLLRMPDGLSVFKVYYLSITGREKRELYEWDHAAHTREEFEKSFLSKGQQGIGFITCFPHITKVFRFSPANETVLDVREFTTVTVQPVDMARGDGFHEFACYAEAMIASREYTAWAKAASVEQYLKYRCDAPHFNINSNRKLKQYMEADGAG